MQVQIFNITENNLKSCKSTIYTLVVKHTIYTRYIYIYSRLHYTVYSI